MAITYTKLKSGDWGIRSDELISAGASVTVTKKDGSTRTETIDRVIWTGDGVTLASIKQRGPSTSGSSGSSRTSPRRSRSYNVCAECGKGGRLVADLEDGLLKHYNCCDIPPSGYQLNPIAHYQGEESMTKTRKVKNIYSSSNGTAPTGEAAALQRKFATAREAMSNTLIERDNEIDLVLTALIAGEHVLLVGPPGTAKSLLLDTLMGWAGGSGFKVLLTKFTEPDEVLGPTSLHGLRDDKYRRVTTGMLPEAEYAFLDEIFKSSSAILNTLLTLLNEREFKNGSEGVIKCPLRLCVAASNEWPNDENGGAELGALFDRFLFRKTVKPVSPSTGRRELFKAALKGSPCKTAFPEPITALELDRATQMACSLPWSKEAMSALREITNALDKEGVTYGDRRFYKSINAVRAFAWLNGATEVLPAHLEILQHVLWEDPTEQPNKAAKIILRLCNPEAVKLEELEATANDVIDKCKPAEAVAKLQSLAASTAVMCGVAHSTATVVARTDCNALVVEAEKVSKNAKALKLLRFMAKAIRFAYSKSIDEVGSKVPTVDDTLADLESLFTKGSK